MPLTDDATPSRHRPWRTSALLAALLALVPTALPLALPAGCGSYDLGPRMAAAPGATLGATVGGAKDIGWARDEIAAGRIPDPASITTEGLFAESDLPLEGGAPRGTLSLDVGVAADEGAILVQVGLASDIDAATWRRPPLDLCAVVDVSGSMADAGKMDSARRALRMLVAHLGPADTLALVRFNQGAGVLVYPRRVEDPREFLEAIDDLRPGGSTNMGEGLRLGYAQVARRDAGTGGRQARVLLLTDALPNQGMLSDADFTALATRYGREGIGLTALGVGVDFGHDLARRISECPGGNSRFLRGGQDLERLFHEDFAFLVSPIAYDLALDVEAAPGFELVESYGVPGGGLRVATVFLSKSKGAIALRFRRAPVVEAGAARAVFARRDGEARGDRRLAEPASPRALAAGDPAPVCKVSLRWRREVDGAPVRDEMTAWLPSSIPASGFASHEGARKTFDLVLLALALKDACANPSDRGAADALTRVAARLEADATRTDDRDLRREARLARRLLQTLGGEVAQAGR